MNVALSFVALTLLMVVAVLGVLVWLLVGLALTLESLVLALLQL